MEHSSEGTRSPDSQANLDVSTGMAADLHSVCLIIIAVPIISAYLESGVEMIPYMTRHNASCIITKVCVILDYDAGVYSFIFLGCAECLTSLYLLLTSFWHVLVYLLIK